MEPSKKTEIIRLAIKSRERAYVPYSNFSVGAAVLTADGEIFTGCNIENLSYPAGICAERTAMFSAVAAGHLEFQGIAVSGGIKWEAPKDICMPCGICLQVMSEFCKPEFPVLIVKNEEEIQEYQLKDLLPHVFDSLEKG